MVGALALASVWGGPVYDGGRTAENDTTTGAAAACRTVGRVAADWTEEVHRLGYGGTFMQVRNDSLDAERRLNRAAERTGDPDVTDALSEGAVYFAHAASVAGTGDLVAVGQIVGRDGPATLESVTAACEPV